MTNNNARLSASLKPQLIVADWTQRQCYSLYVTKTLCYISQSMSTQGLHSPVASSSASEMSLLRSAALLVALMGVVSCTSTGSLANTDLSERTPEERAMLIWSSGDFRFPCSSTRSICLSSGRYIKKNIIGTRMQIWKDKAILAFPRYKEGVPVTVGTTNLVDNKCSPQFSAYPHWSMQEEGNCNAIQNAVDMFVDDKDRLWILDSGITNTVVQPIRRCPPKVVVVCLKTQKVLRVIDLSNLVCPASRLQYLVVDQSANGFTYLYISDAANRSILVWDVYRARGWRVVLPKAVLAGCQRRDVLYMALVRRPCGTSVLHFTYLSSTRMFSIRTEFLRRGCTGGRIVDLGRKPAKIVVLGVDGGSAIFFRYEGHSEVYRWNTMTCFKKENFVMVYQGQSCRLATHVVPDYRRQKMMVLESNFPDFIRGTVGCGASHTIGPLVGCFNNVYPKVIA